MADRICIAPDCERPVIARDCCTMHYQRLMKNGTTDKPPAPGPRTDPVERFWSKVDRDSTPEGCWPWTGGRDQDGYGHFKVNRRTRRAPRYAFNLAHPDDPLADDEMVRHTCDNPPCVRPDHLVRGDAAMNNADQVERGRIARGDRHGSRVRPETVRRGEANAAARLTEEQVREIRRRYTAGEKQVPLATEFGVTQITVSLIVRRKTWTHVEE